MSSDAAPPFLARTGLSLARSLQPIVPLVTRLAVGILFVRTGYGKLGNLDGVATFFESLGIPAPKANAAFIGALELVGGAALIAGLGTRLFAALLSATMIVAILTADRADFLAALRLEGDKDVTNVVPLTLLVFLGWLVAFGAGAISLDRARFSGPRWRSPSSTG